MFDIGWQELFIIAAIAIIVVGPRDLPRALKSISGYISKAKSMVRELQSGIDEVAREVDLENIRKDAQEVGNIDIESELKDTVAPAKAIEKEFDDYSLDVNEMSAAEVNEQETPNSKSGDFKNPNIIENNAAMKKSLND